MIFSGSAVIDEKNTTGFCTYPKGCMVAMFTTAGNGSQTQSLAYSNDLGRTWTYYQNNPVIDEKMADFRDPKAFWHEPTQQWIVVTVLSADHKVRFYSSPDLIHWTPLSDFGPAGLTNAAWECPDVFQLTIDGTNETKWVLAFSYFTDIPRIAYFIGDFDGTTFTDTNPSSPFSSFMEDGKDYYAANTWNSVPDGRRLAIGWLSNFAYIGATPTSPWRGTQSFIREIKLKNTARGLRLSLDAISELASLRASQPANYKNIQLDSNISPVVASNVTGAQLELAVTFSYQNDKSAPAEFGLKVFVGANQETVIGYYLKAQTLFVDRTNSGVTSFHSAFPGRSTAQVIDDQGKLTLHVLLDQSVIEVFNTHNGVAMTNLVFPDAQKTDVQFYVTGGKANVDSFDAWTIQTTWDGKQMQKNPLNFRGKVSI